MNITLKHSLASALVLAVASVAFAQRGPGPNERRGFGPGPRQDPRHAEDRAVFHFLLSNHDKITRQVKQLPNGVETLTESDDPEIAAKIQEHVKWMEQRIVDFRPIRMRDPLFRSLFQNADKIVFKHKNTDAGVRVTETSDDPRVVQLIKAHARTVSGFVDRGFAEAMKNHPVPQQQAAEMVAVAPVIAGHGEVFKLPEAAQQPRAGSKICVDITQGGNPEQLNPAIEKVARFLNIFQGAGRQPAAADFAVVLHGDATLTTLNADAYAKRFGTDNNPNFDCLRQLHEAGVEIYVCGQSLIHHEAGPGDLIVFVDTAVSALTTIVNLQMDGYVHLPLAN